MPKTDRQLIELKIVNRQGRIAAMCAGSGWVASLAIARRLRVQYAFTVLGSETAVFSLKMRVLP